MGAYKHRSDRCGLAIDGAHSPRARVDHGKEEDVDCTRPDVEAETRVHIWRNADVERHYRGAEVGGQMEGPLVEMADLTSHHAHAFRAQIDGLAGPAKDPCGASKDPDALLRPVLRD